MCRVALGRTFDECTHMYVNVRSHTTMYNILRHDVQHCTTMADFKYGVNTDVNIGVSVSRGGNTLFEVMGIC